MFLKRVSALCCIVACVAMSTPPISAQDSKTPPLVRDQNGEPLPPGAIARLGRLAGRPGGPIRFSPDGKTMLIAGTFENTIFRRDGFDGKVLDVYPVAGRPQIFDFSPDGKTVALVDRQDNGGGFLLRDIATGKDVGRVHIADGTAPIGAWFSPDGTMLATSRAKQVVMWEVATSKKICEIDFGADCYRLSFAADGKSFFTVTSREGLVIEAWETRTGKNLRRFANNAFSQAVVSPDGKLMALDGAGLKVVDTETGKDLFYAKVTSGPFGNRAFSPNSEILIADRIIVEARTGKVIAQLESSTHNIVISPDGKRFASNIASGSPAIYETATGKQLRAFTESHFGPIRDVAISPDGKIAYAGGMARIHVWDIAERRILHKILNPGKVSWDFVTDGRALASFANGSLIFWDASTGKERHRIESRGQVIAVDLSPDGKTLAYARINAAKKIELIRWDVAAKQELPAAPFTLGQSLGLLDSVHRKTSVAFSPDGKLIAANDHRQLFLWEHGGAKAPDSIVPKWYMAPSSLRFSPDGKLLAAACSRECIVWDVQQKTERMRMNFRGIPEPMFDDPVHDAVFSPDGRMLFTGHGGMIRIWEVASGELRWTLNAGAKSLAFARHQSLLLSGSADSTMLLWEPKKLAMDTHWIGEKPTREVLERLWTDLAGAPRPAFVTLQRLTTSPTETIPFLAERLRPKAVDVEKVKKTIAALDSKVFQEREAAETELRKLGVNVEDQLRQSMRDNPNVEMRRRIETLVNNLDGPEWFRMARAIEALERIGSRESREILVEIAKNSPSSRIREDANRAASRLMVTDKK